MKKTTLIILSIVLASAAFAQKTSSKFSFALNGDLAMPFGTFIQKDLGKFNDIYSLGYGLGAQVKYNKSQFFGYTLGVGYMGFSPKSVDGEKAETLNAIPVLVGAEFKFTPKVFGSLQLGWTVFGGKAVEGSTLQGFTYAPAVGYAFTDHFAAALFYMGVDGKLKIDNVKEPIVGNLSLLGLRLQYGF